MAEQLEVFPAVLEGAAAVFGASDGALTLQFRLLWVPDIRLQGIRMLAEAGWAVGLPVATQVQQAADAEHAAEHVDGLEVGSGSICRTSSCCESLESSAKPFFFAGSFGHAQ